MKKMILMCVLSFATTVVLSGCNTIAGAGKDMQKAGDKIEETAHDARR